MRIAGLTAMDLSPLFAGTLTVTPGILPGAWGGVIPPITRGGRHRRIDDYVSRQAWQPLGGGTVMLDVGCGFPPQTAVDSALRFSEWQVIGVDPALDPFLLYVGNDLYACIDEEGQVRYFGRQPNANFQTLLARFADHDRTVRWLSEKFSKLLPKLPMGDADEMAVVEEDDCRLIRLPLKQWETSNLTFIQAGIGSRNVPTADLIRCFNVLVYYGAAGRAEFKGWARDILTDGGLAVTGFNSPNATETRFEVYRKEANAVVEKEFAFGVDNLRPLGLGSWFSMADDESSSRRLAQLVGVIRCDGQYMSRLNARFDELLRLHELMVRDADGYLTWAGPDSLQKAVGETAAVVAEQLDRDGFTEDACEVLRHAGFNAWRNEAGFVAVDPVGLTSKETS